MARLTRESRKYIRYELDEGSLTQISFFISETEICSVSALIVNSSFGGSEFLLVSKYPLLPHQKIRITFPELGVFEARVVWSKELDNNIFTIGIEYLTP